MSNALCAGNGGGKSEGKFAWRKYKTRSSLNESSFVYINLDAIMYDCNGIRINWEGNISESVAGEFRFKEGIDLRGKYFNGPSIYGTFMGDGITERRGLDYGVNARRVGAGAELVCIAVDDNPNKYSTGYVRPGEFAYNKIS